MTDPRLTSLSITYDPTLNVIGKDVARTAPPEVSRTAKTSPFGRTATDTPGHDASARSVLAISAAAPFAGTLTVAMKTKSPFPLGAVSVSISSPEYMKPRPAPVTENDLFVGLYSTPPCTDGAPCSKKVQGSGTGSRWVPEIHMVSPLSSSSSLIWQSSLPVPSLNENEMGYPLPPSRSNTSLWNSRPDEYAVCDTATLPASITESASSAIIFTR